MPSERIQRQLDAFLDQAEELANAGEWQQVAEKARAALAIDEASEDASTFLEIAVANGVAADVSAVATRPSPPGAGAPTPKPSEPEFFAGGRYHVQRFLGEGGKKRVFLAHDELLDRDIALSLIKTDGLDEVGRQRTMREAQAMGRLTHQNIVSIYDIGEHVGADNTKQPFLVQELMSGGDVEGLLDEAEAGLPLAQTLDIAIAVSRGLEFAHARGVVHRDLKPGNVWLTSDGVAKIGDLGLAVTVGQTRLTTHGVMVGTYGYMPPEQALGHEVTARSDLYSLGAMLYELVTGRPPFQGDTPTAVISQHLNTQPVAPSWHSDQCPTDLEALILQLLAKVPADRPESATEVIGRLEAVDPEGRSASHSDSQANPLDGLARGAFVGREGELERLRGAFDEAFEGRGSVSMLVGEPGIGKTRTTQELATYVRVRAGVVLWGGAQESSGAPPHWPWLQVARAYRDQTPEEERRKQWQPYAADLQRIFTGLTDLFPGLPEPPPLDSEEGQFRLFDAFSSFLRAVATDKPLLVVLDDLHWADRSTLQMLSHVARELRHARVLVVGTYRDTDLDRQHPLSRTLAELNREQLFTRINLRGLTREEVADYIRAVAQVEPPSAIVDRVHEETEGNPFFLTEVVNLMAQEGSFETTSVSDVAIPEGVKEALGRRLDRLSTEANELLSVAAVLGREFEHDQLVAVTGAPDDEVLRLVEEALAGRVVEETPVVGGYRFTHALMQETLLGELSAARRVRLHGQIAGALESLYPSPTRERVAELAGHYRESALLNREHSERAILLTVRSAEHAREQLAWDDEAHLLEAASDLVVEHGAPAGVDEAVLHRRMTACCYSLGDLQGAVEHFWLCHRLFTDRDDPVSVAEFTAEFGARERLGVHLGPTPSAAAVRRMSPDQRTARPDLVVALRLYGFAEPLAPSAAVDHELKELEALAIDNGLWREQARVLHLRGSRAYAGNDPAAAEELMHRSADLFVEHGFDELSAVGRWMEGFVSQNTKGLDHADAVFAVVEDLDQGRRWADMGHANRISIRALRGDLDLASRSIADRRWASISAVRRLDLSALLAELRGDPDDIAAAIRALEVVSESDIFSPDAYQAFIVGWLQRLKLHLSGSSPLASDLHASWRAALQVVHQFSPGHPRALVVLDRALYDYGDPDLVGEAYEELERLSASRVTEYGSIDHFRGRLALRLDFVDEAEQHFRTGLDWCERERCPLDSGRCHQGLAGIHERRGDRELTTQHLDAAGKLFSKHGAKLYLDQVIAKKEILKA